MRVSGLTGVFFSPAPSLLWIVPFQSSGGFKISEPLCYWRMEQLSNHRLGWWH